MLATLSWIDGDHVDRASLARLARVRDRADGTSALSPLLSWHLIQEPLAGRFTVHAVVRHAVRRRSQPDAARYFEHYVSLLEREPTRLAVEQSHLFAAMDRAHRENDLAGMLRIQRLAATLYDAPT